jgi:hypothetical protein
MADAAPVKPAPIRETNVLWTTSRAVATSSFCLGFWGMLVFWWYPFGLAVSTIALMLGGLSIFMGWRSGDRGFHLAWLGVFFGLTGQGLAIGAYRFPQLAFEGSLPPLIQAIWPF